MCFGREFQSKRDFHGKPENITLLELLMVYMIGNFNTIFHHADQNEGTEFHCSNEDKVMLISVNVCSPAENKTQIKHNSGKK